MFLILFSSAEREEGRLKNDLRRMNTEHKDVIEKKNILEVSHIILNIPFCFISSNFLKRNLNCKYSLFATIIHLQEKYYDNLLSVLP